MYSDYFVDKLIIFTPSFKYSILYTLGLTNYCIHRVKQTTVYIALNKLLYT